MPHPDKFSGADTKGALAASAAVIGRVATEAILATARRIRARVRLVAAARVIRADAAGRGRRALAARVRGDVDAADAKVGLAAGAAVGDAGAAEAVLGAAGARAADEAGRAAAGAVGVDGARGRAGAGDAHRGAGARGRRGRRGAAGAVPV